MAQPSPIDGRSPIAGSVLPIRGAEELIATLQDVISVKVVPSVTGGIDAIHVLVTGGTPAKQNVRNIESALMAQLGLQVDHRKISVAATSRRADGEGPQVPEPTANGIRQVDLRPGRPIYFEDVEVRGSRARGITCRVTLRRGAVEYAGESEEGVQAELSRLDAAARATVAALGAMTEVAGTFSLHGIRLITAFDRELILAGVTVCYGREQRLLTGTCELRESP